VKRPPAPAAFFLARSFGGADKNVAPGLRRYGFPQSILGLARVNIFMRDSTDSLRLLAARAPLI
jgi:hypothetical protein